MTVLLIVPVTLASNPLPLPLLIAKIFAVMDKSTSMKLAMVVPTVLLIVPVMLDSNPPFLLVKIADPSVVMVSLMMQKSVMMVALAVIPLVFALIRII